MTLSCRADANFDSLDGADVRRRRSRAGLTNHKPAVALQVPRPSSRTSRCLAGCRLAACCFAVTVTRWFHHFHRCIWRGHQMGPCECAAFLNICCVPGRRALCLRLAPPRLRPDAEVRVRAGALCFGKDAACLPLVHGSRYSASRQVGRTYSASAHKPVSKSQ